MTPDPLDPADPADPLDPLDPLALSNVGFRPRETEILLENVQPSRYFGIAIVKNASKNVNLKMQISINAS